MNPEVGSNFNEVNESMICLEHSKLGVTTSKTYGVLNDADQQIIVRDYESIENKKDI